MDEYARFARLYDPVVGHALRPVHRTMAAEVRRRGYTSVVDLCCGTGLFSGLGRSAGLDVTGVDVSPSMLAVARQKNPGASFLETDATALPMGAASFDAVTISFGLHEKADAMAGAIFGEALRVVRPGGMVLLADYRLPDRASPLAGWAIRLVERLAGRDHYTCFRAYMRRGGSVGFLERAGVTYELSRTFMSGWAGLFVVAAQ